MKNIIKKTLAFCMCALLLAGAFPIAAFADEVQTVTINTAHNVTVNRGSTAYLTVKAKSSSAAPYKLVLKSQSLDLKIKSGNSGIITSTEETSVIYEVEAIRNASIMQQKLTVQAFSANDEKLLQEHEVIITVIDNSIDYQIGRADTNISYTLSGGDAIYVGDINSLTVCLYNRGNTTVRNAEIMLTELPAGMSIESGAAAQFVGNLNPNKTATATFPIICDKTIVDGSYKITAVCKGIDGRYIIEEGSDGSSSITPNPTSVTITEAFYVPVRGGKAASSDVDNPILMVSDYSTGGSVTAGRNFTLNLTLLNTSKVDLSNIKVTLDTNEFVPIGASNSFYIESIPEGGKLSRSISLSSQRDLSQGAHAIIVNMAYESGKKASLSASDKISVNVVQESRLVIDEILDPGHLTMNDNCYCSVNYRNMGNSQISNLTIRVDGDFSIEGNPVYYVGNLQSGKSDSYSFSFHPNQAGECAGKVNFTYEDAGGSEHSIDKEFIFNIQEGFTPEDFPDDMPMQPRQKTLPSWAWIAMSAVAVIVIIVIVKAVKKHKASKQGALDLDED